MALLIVVSLVLPHKFTGIDLFPNIHIYHVLLLFNLIYIIYTLFVILSVLSKRYELTEERLLIYSGFLSQRREGVELYRVNDYEVVSPFYLRIFGLGNINIFSTDVKTSNSTLLALKEPDKVADSIRSTVEKVKVDKNIHFVKY